ncbi:hypothetical protein HK100_008557, partial [Physocladia obscura]
MDNNFASKKSTVTGEEEVAIDVVMERSGYDSVETVSQKIAKDQLSKAPTALIMSTIPTGRRMSAGTIARLEEKRAAQEENLTGLQIKKNLDMEEMEEELDEEEDKDES